MAESEVVDPALVPREERLKRLFAARLHEPDEIQASAAAGATSVSGFGYVISLLHSLDTSATAL